MNGIRQHHLLAHSIGALLLCLSSAAPAPARAEAFMTASLGQSDWDADCGQQSCKVRDTAGTIRAGYQFTPYFGIEARYFDLGRASATFPSAIGLPAGTVISGQTLLSAKGGGVNAIVSMPFAQRFSVSGIAGMSRAKGNARYSIPPDETEVSKQANKPYYGVHVAYKVAPDFIVSLEADRYRVALPGSTISIDMWGTGFSYRFR